MRPLLVVLEANCFSLRPTVGPVRALQCTPKHEPRVNWFDRFKTQTCMSMHSDGSPVIGPSQCGSSSRAHTGAHTRLRRGVVGNETANTGVVPRGLQKTLVAAAPRAATNTYLNPHHA